MMPLHLHVNQKSDYDNDDMTLILKPDRGVRLRYFVFVTVNREV